MFRSKMGAFRCIHIHAACLVSCLNKVKVGLNVYCALIGQSHRSCGSIDWTIECAVIQSHPIFIGPEHSTNMPHISGCYTVRCKRADIVIRLSSYNDKEA